MAIDLPNEMRKNIDTFEKILFDLNNLFVVLGIHNDHVKISESVIYMIANAYLSEYYIRDYPTLYAKLERKVYIPFDLDGMIVFAGHGVCRHVSSLLNHIFSRMGYISSLVFVYSPELEYSIDLEEDLTIDEIQKIVHESIKGLDLFSKCDISYERVFRDAKVSVHYKPCETLLNHVINIVKSYSDDSISIVDPSFRRIGFERTDDRLNMALTGTPGCTIPYYVLDCPDFMTYYGTKYDLGIELYNEFNNCSLESVLNKHNSSLESIKEFIPEFENFKKMHESEYREMQNNFHVLARKL